MEPDDVVIADITRQARDALEDFLLCFSCFVCFNLLLFFNPFNFIHGAVVERRGGFFFLGGGEDFFFVFFFLFFYEPQLHADL